MEKAPVFEYDERYVANSVYTIDELYKLQKIVLELMEKNPNTYTYDLKKIRYNQNEIDIILTMIKAKKIKDSV